MNARAMACALACLLLGGALAGCAVNPGQPTGLSTGENAAAAPELILRYAENQPEDYPTTKAALIFADMVAQRTDGRVKVKVYPDGELGSELSVIDQMKYGGIDFSRVSLSQMAEYSPELDVLQLPYLYTDADQMWRVLDGEIGDEFLGGIAGLNLRGLSWFDAGVRSIYTREPVANLEDLKGLKIRVQESQLMSDMVTELGAQPVQLVYSQVYVALRKGDIDGAENNWPSYAAMGHYEVAPYMLLDEHTRVPEMQIMSAAAEQKLAALDKSYPDVIRACARTSAIAERKLWVETQEKVEQELRNAGVTVTELSDLERARFRTAVAPLYEAYDAESDLIERIRTS